MHMSIVLSLCPVHALCQNAIHFYAKYTNLWVWETFGTYNTAPQDSLTAGGQGQFLLAGGGDNFQNVPKIISPPLM